MRQLLEHRYEKLFTEDGYGMFRGVFDTFRAAELSAPSNKPLGFDNEGYTREFQSRFTKVYSFDYPVLVWLGQILRAGMKLFDFGGHRGPQYYSYSKYIKYPEDLQWMVCDLPEIVAAGRKLAEKNGATQLSFTTSIQDADGSDIFLAAGSIQYVESPSLPEMLAGLKKLPDHVLLNKVPLYPGRKYVTLQNGGPAFHPQYVFNREEFIRGITDLRYSLVDQWDVPSHPGRIPFHPEVSFRSHSGLYFKRAV